MRSLKVLAEPETEPVSVADLRAHAHLDDGGDDADLGRIITAARKWAERFTGRTFMQTLFTLTLDGFPSGGVVRLPGAPLLTVDAVRVLDAAYDPTLIDPATYRLVGRDLVPLAAWPTPGAIYGGIEIDFSAGYGTDPTAVPGDVILAILKAASFHNENRETQIQESGAGQLLSPYKIFEVT